MDGTIIIGVLILLIVVFIFIRATQNEPRIQPHVESFGSRGSYNAHIPHYREEERCSSEYEAAQIAHSEDGVTHLLTNEGKLYRSNTYTHAEVILTWRTQALNITRILIKNSPCARCSRVLRNFFQHCRKPIIYVGHIYRPNNQEDREGLKNLVQQGFELKVWEILHTMMHGPYDRITP